MIALKQALSNGLKFTKVHKKKNDGKCEKT